MGDTVTEQQGSRFREVVEGAAELFRQELPQLLDEVSELLPVYAGIPARLDIFGVLNITTDEDRHTECLRWLLDPTAGHGFGDALLRRFLLRTDHTAAIEHALRSVPIDAKVRTQLDVPGYGIPDLVVILRTRPQCIVVVEAKINAPLTNKDGISQTRRYREAVRDGMLQRFCGLEDCGSSQVSFVFLPMHLGQSPQDELKEDNGAVHQFKTVLQRTVAADCLEVLRDTDVDPAVAMLVRAFCTSVLRASNYGAAFDALLRLRNAVTAWRVTSIQAKFTSKPELAAALPNVAAASVASPHSCNPSRPRLELKREAVVIGTSTVPAKRHTSDLSMFRVVSTELRELRGEKDLYAMDSSIEKYVVMNFEVVSQLASVVERARAEYLRDVKNEAKNSMESKELDAAILETKFSRSDYSEGNRYNLGVSGLGVASFSLDTGDTGGLAVRIQFRLLKNPLGDKTALDKALRSSMPKDLSVDDIVTNMSSSVAVLVGSFDEAKKISIDIVIAVLRVLRDLVMQMPNAPTAASTPST